MPPDNRILIPPRRDKTRAKVSVKPNMARISKINDGPSSFFAVSTKAFMLFDITLTNALRQLTALKSGHPAPFRVFTENCCVIPVAVDKDLAAFYYSERFM
ncbi:hypothetical protein ACFL9U_05410 [Thermodesulfobacteriota bacterium]